ncbi:MAG TPA: hypothetical protein VK610_04380, partial [Rhodothermales bacterium]|nr:hypothetical protein [Rhodothermales bacterium]
GVARNCGTRFVVEGVQFRLVPLDVERDELMPEVLATPIQTLVAKPVLTRAERSRLRNLLAHWCLGTVESAAFAADLLGPFAPAASEPAYGPLDALRDLDADDAGRLAPCEVPLALLYWAQDALAFVDVWSVRRRVHRRPAAASPPFPALDRRAAEVHAAALQFQTQIAELTGTGVSQAALAQMRVADYFRFLPPVGAVPERVGAARGFTHLEFFQGKTFREPVFIEGAKVGPLFSLAAGHDPVDLDADEVIWLYRVRQNRQPGSTGAGPGYLLFAGGHVPYAGDAQYDLARWNYSNYGLGVAESIVIAL